MRVHYRKLICDPRRACFVAAFAMTIVVVLAGALPSAAQALSNQWHWPVHLAAFTVLAAAWACSLPRIPSLIVTLTIMVFAFVHEAIEIVGHSHGYEMGDVTVDAAGVIAGVWFARVLMNWRRPTPCA